MPWMQDKHVRYFGVQSVPDVMPEHDEFTPRVHTAVHMNKARVFERECFEKVVEERKAKARFNKRRDAL